MNDLPYAEPNQQNFNERLPDVMDASREIDEFCERTARGIMIHPATYDLYGRQRGLFRYSAYPIVRADVVMSGTDVIAPADYKIMGERNNIICFEEPKADVTVQGQFGYGRLQRVGIILAGHAIAAMATSFTEAAFGVGNAPSVAAGRVFLIESEMMYYDGTGLVRGANGTRPAEHGAGIAVYRVHPPAVVRNAALVVSQGIDAVRARARDADAPVGTTAPAGAAAAAVAADARRSALLSQFERQLMRYRYRGPLSGW